MKNSRQIWEETSKELEKVYDRREAESIGYLLLEDLFGINKASVLAMEEKAIDEESLVQALKRLLQHEPIQYVTGIADFYGRQFWIQPGALIPRPETEELVDLIVRENELTKPKILDVGVGSGCIAISLALQTNGEVYGVDLSEDAVAIATSNATRLGAKVSFSIHDVLNEDFPLSDLDILVSNPPYIPENEKATMNENVTRYEPGLALFVPDDDPLIFYRRIAEAGVKSIRKGGKLYLEIHENFGKKVCEMLDKLGYADIKIHSDMQGKDRMVSATNSASM